MFENIFSWITDVIGGFVSTVLPILVLLYFLGAFDKVFGRFFGSGKKPESDTSHIEDAPKKDATVSEENKSYAWKKFRPKINRNK